MKRLLIAIVLSGVASGAWVQGRTPTWLADDYKGYVAGVGGGTYAGKGGALFGGEVGWKLAENVEVFGEVGRMTDITSSSSKDAADTVAAYLNSLGLGTATGSVKTPVNYGAVGVRYFVMTTDRYQPYLVASVGGANVERKPAFTVSGADVTGSLSSTTYGVQLGKDLDGKSNRAMVTAGGGVRVPVGRMFVDANVRYGRVFTEVKGTSIVRFTAGVGYRF